jgi:hypothetical protein
VQTAVQQMPYSYKGITAQDIMDYSGEVRQLTPEQMAVADVNQDGAIDLLDAIWINQMAEGLRDPNSLEGIDQPVPQPPAPPPMMPDQFMGPADFPTNIAGVGGGPKTLPGPPPMMPDPVQAAVDKLPGEPGFPGRGPKFPGVPPVQIPEPVGPIGMPPTPPKDFFQWPVPPQGGGGPTPEQLAQLQIDQEAWKTNPIRFMAEPYWMSPNWWENRPAPTIDTEAGGGKGGDMVKPPWEDPSSIIPTPSPVGNGDVPPWWEDVTSCPRPEEHIQLANNDWILAGELKVGDEVVTSEEPQKVTFAKTIENSPRREVLFKEGDSIVTSPSHPYFVKDKGFVDVEDLKEGDAIGDLIVKEVQPFSDGPVIHISVDKAETYMLRGGTEENPVPALSHNKKISQEPPTPGIGTIDPEDPPPGWPADKPWPPDKPIFGPGVGPMCPSPKEHIQLANNDWILAGELKVGDEVVTSEEPQKVTRVQRIEGAPRCEVLFEDSDSIVSSYSHPYFVNSKGFVEVGNLEKGDIIGDLVVKDKKPFSDGPVISLSVDKAETYMLRGGTEESPVPALSHNKTIEMPKPPWPPQPPTPMGEPLPQDHPFFQSPEYLKFQEQGGMGTMDMYTASDGTQFGSGTVGKMYEKWLQQYSTPPTPVTPTTPVTTTPVTPTTPVTTTPVTPTTPVTTPTTPVTTTPVTPETTAVQGTTMEEMQKMIADMQAQMQEQAAARAAQEAQMSKNYMISDERIGYNPYLSGQYQPDPYGPGGVPDMGGITTIPVPQPLTGIGYANYNPRRKI